MARPRSTSAETQPLLRHHDEQAELRRKPTGIWRVIPRFDTIHPRYRFLPLIGCLVVFLNEAEYFFKNFADYRAIEALHCIEYYNVVDPSIAALGKHIPERLCKADIIQEEVSLTYATSMGIRMLCSFIGAIPLGQLADWKGRRLVVIMHKVNLTFSVSFQLAIYLLYPILPIRFWYLTGVTSIFGGNFDLGLAMLFASYTDVIPSAAQRTTLFFLTTSMQYYAQFLIPPIGGFLINLDGQGTTPQVGMIVAICMGLCVILVTVLFFPETKGAIAEGAKPNNSKPDNTENDQIATGERPNNPARPKTTHKSRWPSMEGLGLFNLFLLVICLFNNAIGVKATDWYGLVQYPVVKFGWTFSKATTITSVQALVTLINYAVLLPAYTRLGAARHISAASTSLYIMSLSLVLLAGGSVLLGLSPVPAFFFLAMVIYTLGSGFQVSTQAYIAGLVSKTQLARILAMLSMSASGGKMVASGAFPQIFALGLESGVEVLKGLPFFVAAVLFVIAGVALTVVVVRARRVRAVSAVEEREGLDGGHEGA